MNRAINTIKKINRSTALQIILIIIIIIIAGQFLTRRNTREVNGSGYHHKIALLTH